MSDLISRQAAIDVIIEDKICDDSLKIMTVLGDRDKAETLNMTCDRHAKMLMSLPSSQPEQTGKWRFNADGMLVCSNCYEIPTNRILLNGNMVFDMTPIREKMKYCPNCGCRMLKEGEEYETN